MLEADFFNCSMYLVHKDPTTGTIEREEVAPYYDVTRIIKKIPEGVECEEAEFLIATAANTGETNDYLRKVVENQNAYIDLLNQQIEAQKQIIEKDKEQLQLLESIFVSSENGVLVEKEILQLIEDQIDSTHPLWDFVKEKGGDVLVNSATTGLPIIFNAIKLYIVLAP